ncbi:DUF1802 family protein [Paenibacillus doosanensis]|uniref:DUF1802 family protein n=1 Tax=Paenibacillus konkukensis TaxID=2020716 RepID=A0ABY4RMK7_9BACL|nr:MULTISPECIES: DUF1802 family protein [Paenibacillus]MCS7463660.1 DUF1802 family protein [Paenibacillus doosanensis]UQZ83185.1 hypothetical protein SK3146_02346 [Paenibacillus konkukensis]
MVETEPAALKEWAVAVEALRSGRQILIMRKGGIREETRDFQVESESFYLFPTYEHQKKQWMKPEHQADLDKTLEGWSPQDTEVTIRCYAELFEDILIADQQQLNQLSEYHIWTDSFAEERLKWKRAKPLHVMLLRIYELSEPVRIPVVPEYNGCKSWIQLKDAALKEVRRKPVLSDAEFEAAVARIKSSLG